MGQGGHVGGGVLGTDQGGARGRPPFRTTGRFSDHFSGLGDSAPPRRRREAQPRQHQRQDERGPPRRGGALPAGLPELHVAPVVIQNWK